MGMKQIIASNLTELRKAKGLTQGDLAKRLNYSDKAVSKWEHGDALPDIEILSQLCDLYGVTLNDIVEPDAAKKNQVKKEKGVANKRNEIVITLLATVPVWIIGLIIYISLLVFQKIHCYPIFLWCLPVSAIVLLVFNGVWGKHKYIFLIVSILVWTFLASAYITLIYIDLKLANLWYIFFLGIPLQIATLLWGQLETKSTKNQK